MKHKGFSLVELVVAVAVLCVLVALFSQMFTMVSGTWRAGRAQANNFNQARIAMDVISRDLQAAVIRPDLPSFFDDAEAMTFFTKDKSLKADGTMGRRPLTAVLYAVATIDGESMLRRKSLGFDYGEDVGYMPALWKLPIPEAGLDSGIGPGVLVMRYQFICSDGKNRLPSQVNQGWKESATLPGVEALRAVIVSLAVIDDDEVRLLQSTNTLEILRTNFSAMDPGPLRSYSSAWRSQVEDPAQPLSAGGVPRKALQNLRTFERTTLLPVLRKETL